MPIVTGNGGSSPALAATTRLTDAQILGMSVTPVVAVAGAAGFAIMPLQMCLVVKQGGAVYTAPNGTYNLRALIGTGSGWAGDCIVANVPFNGAAPGDQTAILGQFVGANGAFYNDAEPLSLLDGLALRYTTSLAVGGGDGTGSAIIYTVYALVPLT